MNRHSLKPLWTLMRREIWESPISFKWTPLGLAALVVLVAGVSLAIGARMDAEMAFTLDAMRLFAETDPTQKRLIVSGLLFSSTILFFQLILFLIVFYLASCLFDDRKDRSILFWKSLPVSDGLTVMSKLLTACVTIPALFFVAIVLTHVALLMIASAYAVMAGINPITHLWLPASLPRLWSVMAFGMLVQGLWLLPIYGWLLFCSSWAPRLPILIAVAIPAGLALAQHSYSLISGFRLPEYNIGLIILRRLGAGILPGNANIEIENGFENIQFNESLFMSFSTVLNHLTKPEMWAGWLLAALFLYGAIWFRRRATDQ